MSVQALKSIGSDTGTFTIAKDPARDQAPVASGKVGFRPGNPLPEANVKSRPNLEQLAAQLNMASQSIGRDLRFQVDLESGRSVIQVLDRETGEIIRQIPAEKVSASLNAGSAVNFSLYDEMV